MSASFLFSFSLGARIAPCLIARFLPLCACRIHLKCKQIIRGGFFGESFNPTQKKAQRLYRFSIFVLLKLLFCLEL